MKSNGKTFVVRTVLFAMCAMCLLSALSRAETVHGTFKLPVEAHWGRMVLAPGAYEFVVDTESTGRMLIVHSETSSFAGMVMYSSISEVHSANGSSLALGKREEGTYVQALYLKDAGIVLNFKAPKGSAVSKVAKTTSSTTMAASGTH